MIEKGQILKAFSCLFSTVVYILLHHAVDISNALDLPEMEISGLIFDVVIRMKSPVALFRPPSSFLSLSSLLGSYITKLSKCCCCLPCNHCSKSTWVVWALVIGWVLRSIIWNYAIPLTSLELCNYYLTLAMSKSILLSRAYYRGWGKVRN